MTEQKLVPVEPTEAMLRRGGQELAMTRQRPQNTAEDDARDCWQAMIGTGRYAYVEDHDILSAAPPAPSGWRSMESAPRDRTPIRALIHADLYPRVKPARDDLERWNGQEIVVHHPGIAEDGFDMGWNLAAPAGHGGFPDEWFVGWLPTGSAAPSPDTGKMGGSDAAKLVAYEDAHAVAVELGYPSLTEALEALSAPVSGGEGEAVAWQCRIYDYKGQPGEWSQCSPPDDPTNLRPSRIIEYRLLYTHPSDPSATERMMAALGEALEYVERFEDVVDGDDGIPSPNEAMSLARTIRAALGEA